MMSIQSWAILAVLGLGGFAPSSIGAATESVVPEIVRGPSKFCFAMSNFGLLVSERAVNFTPGVHTASVTIQGPSGEFLYIESDGFARVETVSIVELELMQNTNMQFEMLRNEDGPAYVIFERDADLSREIWPIVRLEGPAFNGSEVDHEILMRFRLGLRDEQVCDFNYRYGFEDLFPGVLAPIQEAN